MQEQFNSVKALMDAVAAGPQGLPGEVTQTDLNNAELNMLSQSSAHSHGVATLSVTADGT